MFQDLTSQLEGLHFQLVDTDARIDHALDSGKRREFKLWCRRRATLAARLQSLLIRVATNT